MNTKNKTLSPTQFQKCVLSWFDQNGRKNLPWQTNKTPYRVWVSEIMLQQTQVATVIPYFQQFLKKFPTVHALAAASIDEVLHLWSGLGYYARARNLHSTAQKIAQCHHGEFPASLAELVNLPGIGRSTAGAIMSIAFNKATPILDGNVKRVLTRFAGIKDPINDKSVEAKLWQLAENYTPKQRASDYTQAMMDLGSIICKRSKPLCQICPLKNSCVAFKTEETDTIPYKKKGKALPVKKSTFLIFKKGNEVLLSKRLAKGIWGGLWSFPEAEANAYSFSSQKFAKQFKIKIKMIKQLPYFRHTFTHYHLDILPILFEIEEIEFLKYIEEQEQIWYNLKSSRNIGLPKPVKQLIQSIM